VGSFTAAMPAASVSQAVLRQVPINTIMRYNHYFEAQGREKYALAKYADLPGPKADLCYNCQDFCETACPYHVPIQGKLIFAHQQLSLA